MDKQRMDIIMPARANISRSRKKTEPDLFLSDLLHVNPIVDKRNSSSKNKSNISLLNNNFTRSVKKFENNKQEQYHRLNRESKIKQNDQWIELLKKSSTDNSATSSKSLNTNCYKKLQETNLHINEATAQLKQISSFIEAKKKQMTNKSTVLNISHPTVKTSKTSGTNTNIKHLCTKEIYSEKLNDVKSMMKYIDKHLNIENKSESKRVITQKEKNNIQRKKLNNTLGLVNTKLSKVKDKYFTNDSETIHINSIINRKPKYRSVKELMKMDKTRLSTMEASKIIQAELENDINNLTESSELFNVPKNNHMEVLFENVDLIQKESFQDNFSDELRAGHSNFSNMSSAVTPRELLHGSSKKYLNTNFYTRNDVREEKKIPICKSVAVDTQPPDDNKLQRSIMKSDYLMREFGLGSAKYITPTDNNKMENTISNEPKKWARDLEYFMT